MWILRRLFKQANINDWHWAGKYNQKFPIGIYTRKELIKLIDKMQIDIDFLENELLKKMTESERIIYLMNFDKLQEREEKENEKN